MHTKLEHGQHTVIWRHFSQCLATIRVHKVNDGKVCIRVLCFASCSLFKSTRWCPFPEFHVMMSRLIDFSIGLDVFGFKSTSKHINMYSAHFSCRLVLLFSCWFSPSDTKSNSAVAVWDEMGNSTRFIHANEMYSEAERGKEIISKLKARQIKLFLHFFAPETRTSALIARLLLNDVGEGVSGAGGSKRRSRLCRVVWRPNNKAKEMRRLRHSNWH